MSNLRPGFIKIIGNWHSIQDLKDIPARIKRINEWAKGVYGLSEHEEKIVAFMKDVQSTREFVRQKPKEDEPDDE